MTAVEIDPKIAKVYGELYPDDEVIVGDAHQFLLVHANEFDFIWSSPPCQSHSRMIKSGRNRKPRYPDLKLYEEIMFLRANFDGKWVVENVVPYYDPLVPFTAQVGRHIFWSNFNIEAENVKQPKNFMSGGQKQVGKEALMDWLDIHYEGNIYYNGNHCPAQVLRNCVHPKLGQQIFEQVELNMQEWTCCNREECVWMDGKGDNDHCCVGFVECAITASTNLLSNEEAIQTIKAALEYKSGHQVEFGLPIYDEEKDCGEGMHDWRSHQDAGHMDSSCPDIGMHVYCRTCNKEGYVTFDLSSLTFEKPFPN